LERQEEEEVEAVLLENLRAKDHPYNLSRNRDPKLIEVFFFTFFLFRFSFFVFRFSFFFLLPDSSILVFVMEYLDGP
jgi:hypothetical protein